MLGGSDQTQSIVKRCLSWPCSNQSPSRAPRAATRGGCFAAACAACAACESTWLGEELAWPAAAKRDCRLNLITCQASKTVLVYFAQTARALPNVVKPCAAAKRQSGSFPRRFLKWVLPCAHGPSPTSCMKMGHKVKNGQGLNRRVHLNQVLTHDGRAAATQPFQPLCGRARAKGSGQSKQERNVKKSRAAR